MLRDFGSTAVKGAGTRIIPLASLAPTYSAVLLGFLPEARMSEGSKLVFISLRLGIDTSTLDSDQTRALMQLLSGSTVMLRGNVNAAAADVDDPPVTAAPRKLTEAEERKARLRDRVKNLLEAYRARLGEPPTELGPAIGNWLTDGKYTEQMIRDGMTEVVAMGVSGRFQRYQELKTWLQDEYRRRRDEPGEEGVEE